MRQTSVDGGRLQTSIDIEPIPNFQKIEHKGQIRLRVSIGKSLSVQDKNKTNLVISSN
jgi:hypothetical protein